MSELRDRIVRSLRNSDVPARSAKQLSEDLDASVKAINGHLNDLADKNRVQTIEIGNATAYYVRTRDLPAHEKPDHYCSKCGREINDNQDSARIELEQYFSGHRNAGHAVEKEVLCRFCYHDLTHWLHNDEHLMHVYPHVEEWDIPEHQVNEVKDDPEIETDYPGEE